MTFGYWRAARVLIATGLVAGTSMAAAQQPTSEQIAAIRASCRSDFMADCKGVQPGGADALHCLQRNAAALSPPCKAAVAATMSAPATAAHPANAPDAAVPPPPAAMPPAPAVAPLKVRPFIMPQRRGDFGDLRRRRTEVVCRRAARRRPHPRVPGGTCGWYVTGMLRRDRPRQREIAPDGGLTRAQLYRREAKPQSATEGRRRAAVVRRRRRTRVRRWRPTG